MKKNGLLNTDNFHLSYCPFMRWTISISFFFFGTLPRGMGPLLDNSLLITERKPAHNEKETYSSQERSRDSNLGK